MNDSTFILPRATRTPRIAPDDVDTDPVTIVCEVDELLMLLADIEIIADDETEMELTRLYDSLRQRVDRFEWQRQQPRRVRDVYADQRDGRLGRAT